MRLDPRHPALVLTLCALGSGCYSGISVNPSGAQDGAGEGGGEDSASGETGDSDDDDGDDSSGGDDVEVSCETFEVGPAPMRRLTREQYNNTVRDLLGEVGRPADGFIDDEVIGGFASNSIAALDAGQLDQYMAAAESIADRAVAERWDAVVGCAPADDACLRTFITDFGGRAFRRPLTETEQADYLQLFDDAEGEAEDAVAVVLQAFLLSPSFLYHVEVGADEDGGLVRLSDYELASRLSYFLWESMPDEELFELAEAGMLSDPQTRVTQAQRMLEDDRARDTIASFHEQWLSHKDFSVQTLEQRVKDPELFPQWNEDLAESMKAETIAFTDEVIRRGDGTVETLLTADWSIISPDLAELYGVPAPAAGMERVELDSNTRSGLLTHASVMSAFSHAAEKSWVYRGLFIRERLLCAEFPPPPVVEDVDLNDPDRLNDPQCAGCHTLIDPVGQGFDTYSPIGAFRTTDEFGQAVSGAGEFLDLPELGAFDGPVELGQKLAGHPLVTRCMTSQWFRYLMRRHERDADACELDVVRQRFAESGGNIPLLISELVRSESFQFRAAEDM